MTYGNGNDCPTTTQGDGTGMWRSPSLRALTATPAGDRAQGAGRFPSCHRAARRPDEDNDVAEREVRRAHQQT